MSAQRSGTLRIAPYLSSSFRGFDHPSQTNKPLMNRMQKGRYFVQPLPERFDGFVTQIELLSYSGQDERIRELRIGLNNVLVLL